MNSEEPSPPSKPRLLTVRGILTQFGIFWILYTLSIGPMYWTWYEATYIRGPKWVLAFYGPLQFACETVPIYGRWVDNYVWWWNSPQSKPVAEPNQHLAAG